MQTSVHWLENVAFQANSESGHQIIMDGSAEYGGENRGPRPMELILMGLGHDVKDKQVAKAVELSAEKYCSASKMLSDGGVEITHDYEIIAAE
ncbi:hypothetical protein FQR65_LT16947 [Abscondita terminalis]|nr:hypothetical protein FQR65_LT16947 [Abscondita terminalis]